MLFAAAAVAQPELRDELFEMFTADQDARDLVVQRDFKDQKSLAQMKALDARHTARLKEVVAKYGWPGKSLVGEKAVHAAWLLVQHADADPAFQRRCLDLMEKSPGEVSAKDIAYLTDRVLLAEGKPQRFGTQFQKNEAGQWVPKTLEDPGHVDDRRRSAGLEPIADYARKMAEMYDRK
ncbi:MAG: DUF6624 domain-containing protein [Myxococcales bacterium]